ncbi:MAG TPA: HEPN domain-containing protein [Terriglobales bacterium]|nr:HEPN domain-containing protein [Terriglobales bacterium]
MATTKTSYRNSRALLNTARKFYKGAEAFYALDPGLTDVLYLLYFHSVENGLKAYLKANGRERWGHDIGQLYSEAKQLGLRIDLDESDGHNLHNVVNLLESGDPDSVRRYFTLESRNLPDLAQTREVVAELMDAVTAILERAAVLNTPATRVSGGSSLTADATPDL